MTYKLSVLIPARNEYFLELDLLHQTVSNVLANTTEQTEVIVVLDGYGTGWPLQPLPNSPRITVIHHAKSIGQRAATNEAARASRAKYICKLDAHCAVGPEFDAKLLAQMRPDWTIVPRQYNLHAFDWKCKQCGERTYQGPKPPKCEKCGSKYHKLVVVWHPTDGTGKERGVSRGGWKNAVNDAWRFDSQLVFQYWGAWANKFPPEQTLIPTMSLLGACWAMERERYWYLDGLDEKMGSWGQMGTEIACKTWLSGGQLLTNRSTWFAHLFRTQREFGFPYPAPSNERPRARSREIWLNDAWPKAKYSLKWLIDKFAPVPDWPNVPPTKCALYYTCNSHERVIEEAARRNLLRSKNGYELGCVSRERTDFGDWNIVVDLPKSGATMQEQILQGLERSTSDYVFLCESDVFYHPSHFEFTPPRDDTFYYNTNVWRVRYSDGHAVRTDNLQQVSGICASRKLLLDHYRKRVALIRDNGGTFDVKRMAYEPGTRGKFGDEKIDNWQSPYANIDLTGHGRTLTTPHFSIDSFRNKRYAQGWAETDDEIPGWGKIAGRVQEFLAGL